MSGSRRNRRSERDHDERRRRAAAGRSSSGSAASGRPSLALLGEERVPKRVFDVGESLAVAATGLRPRHPHRVVVRTGNTVVATAGMITDDAGHIAPTVVWPQLGLEGIGRDRAGLLLPYVEARKMWSAKRFEVHLLRGREVVLRAAGQVSREPARPFLMSADDQGRPLNAFEVGQRVVVLVAANLPFGGTARAYMVERQRRWLPGDPIRPVRLADGRVAAADVAVESETSGFSVRLASASQVAPGAYDFIVRQIRYGYEDGDELDLRPTDVVAHRDATGLVIRQSFMASKTVRGGCVNFLRIAGRTISGRPYYQYADTFQVGEDVYGALDPAALAPNHQGKMVALYVVPHKSASQWSADTSLNNLAVLGGNASVPRFLTQTGCINFNERLLWPNPQLPGEYDIVADFGNNTSNPATFAPDNSFDAPLDIIDGYFLPGIRVVPDPTMDTSFSSAGFLQYDETTQGSITVTDDNGNSWIVPLRANVFFPADAPGATTPAQISAAQPNYPLVVVVHGNGPDNSQLGYDYLLQHLAQNGFIAASVYMKPNQTGTDRARVALRHIEILKALFGAKLANNIGLMGHSRGGEAVVIATRVNQQEAHGNSINAVISLAPTDKYTNETFGGAWATPYLVIYGALDGDVAGPSQTGFQLFDRAFGEQRSMIFVYGAIHDRFNTVWADGDLGFGKIGPSDLPNVISSDAHHKIAMGYMAAFFRQHLRAENQWIGMFRGEWVPAAVAQSDPNKLKVYAQYFDTTKVVVDGFDGPYSATSWQTSTIGGIVSDDGTLPATPAADQLRNLDTHSPHDTGGLQLHWSAPGDHLRFDIPSPSKDVSAYEAISIRVTQKVDSPLDPAGPMVLHVTLKDLNGNVRSIRTDKFAEIPQPQQRAYDQYTKSALRTVRIPLSAYTIQVIGTVRVDLTNIQRAELDFDVNGTGEIEIDSLEFTK